MGVVCHHAIPHRSVNWHRLGFGILNFRGHIAKRVGAGPEGMGTGAGTMLDCSIPSLGQQDSMPILMFRGILIFALGICIFAKYLRNHPKLKKKYFCDFFSVKFSCHFRFVMICMVAVGDWMQHYDLAPLSPFSISSTECLEKLFLAPLLSLHSLCVVLLRCLCSSHFASCPCCDVVRLTCGQGNLASLRFGSCTATHTSSPSAVL